MTIYTTEHFWDCECKDNYMHPSIIMWCFKCGAKRNEQPDSHIEEVIALLKTPYPNKTITLALGAQIEKDLTATDNPPITRNNV